MQDYFGEVIALTYVDYGATGSNVYVAGTTNTCYYDPGSGKIGSEGDSCWDLSINRMKPTGLMESQR